MKLPKTFNEAEILLVADPLNPNIINLLDELKKETPKKFHREFSYFYEGAYSRAPMGYLL